MGGEVLMACSICHHEGHNRSTCPENPENIARRAQEARDAEEAELQRQLASDVARAESAARDARAQHRLRVDTVARRERVASARRRGQLKVAGGGALVVVGTIGIAVALTATRKPDDAPLSVSVQPTPPEPPPASKPRPALRPRPVQPVHPAELPPLPSTPPDARGLVDGGIPGAPSSWKPVEIPGKDGGR
jgi:hypothetical protein